MFVAPFASVTATNGFPSVFRPVFANDGTSVRIIGYEEIPDAGLQFINRLTNTVDVTDPLDRGRLAAVDRDHMVTGIPAIVGVKKGFPNFNEVAAESLVEVTRRLELVKHANNGPVAETNQMYTLTVTNFFGVELWNSYTNRYPRNVELHGQLRRAALQLGLEQVGLVDADEALVDDFSTRLTVGDGRRKAVKHVLA